MRECLHKTKSTLCYDATTDWQSPEARGYPLLNNEVLSSLMLLSNSTYDTSLSALQPKERLSLELSFQTSQKSGVAKGCSKYKNTWWSFSCQEILLFHICQIFSAVFEWALWLDGKKFK